MATSGTSATTAEPGHDIFVTLLGEVIGISILAIIADSSDGAGKVIVAIVAGWFLIFLMTNASWLSKAAEKL